MTRNVLSNDYLVELSEDVIWHLARFGQGSMDLVTLLLIGGLVSFTTLHAAEAGSHRRPMFGVSAQLQGSAGIALTSSHAPTSCALTNDLLASPHSSCTAALMLTPAAI